MTNKEAFEFIRKEIMHEYQLLNSRISWFASCQSFLVTAYALSLGNHGIYLAGWLGQWLLPSFGLILCIPASYGVSGAVGTINLWIAKQYDLTCHPGAYVELESILIDRFILSPEKDHVHKRSERFAIFIPWAFGSFWAISFVLARILPVEV